MDYEIHREKLETLGGYYTQNVETRNEATTRLQLIDRLFFECLGWERQDCVAEESHEGRYADYTFSLTHKVLIVEAKREGNYFELPVGSVEAVRSIASLSRDYPNLGDAIRQAAGYCQSRGVPLAAVCNGHQLVAFIAVRDDGQPPLEGQALVYDSYESMLANFLILWNCLSKSGVAEGRLKAKLLHKSTLPLPSKLSNSILSYPGSRRRNIFQTDLQIASELVLEDLTRARETEELFLQECYSQSGALSQYALISKQILQARYSALFEKGEVGPVLLPAMTRAGLSPELFAESLSRRPILLIGDVGVGKSTFIRHLIVVDAREVFTNSLTFYLDLGSQAALSADLRSFVIDDIARQLRDDHGIDVNEASFVRGVYHGELERFRRGIYGNLRETNPTKYQEKELDFLEGKLTKVDSHLKESLTHLERARRRQLVLFIDNADQRDDAVQQQAFLIAQEIASNWPVTVFLALRPETFHRSMVSGALSGYHPKAFTISPPRIDRVIDKRLNFALRLAKGEVSVSSLQDNIQYRFSRLAAIIEVFKDSLQTNDELMEAIENIAAGNVRRALDFVRDFFGSGHVDTQKIYDIWEQTRFYQIPLHEFMRAVIYGDASHYDPSRSPVANLFDISTRDGKEHFALSILIQVAGNLADHNGAGFIELAKIYMSLQGLGFSPSQIDFALIRGLEKGLIESSSRPSANERLDRHGAVRISSKGAYHLQRLIHRFFYFDAVVVDVPILDEDFRKNINDVQTIQDRLNRADCFRQYLNQQWEEWGAAPEVFGWRSISERLLDNLEQIRRRVAAREYHH